MFIHNKEWIVKPAALPELICLAEPIGSMKARIRIDVRPVVKFRRCPQGSQHHANRIIASLQIAPLGICIGQVCRKLDFLADNLGCFDAGGVALITGRL